MTKLAQSTDAYSDTGARTRPTKRCRCGWPASRQCDHYDEASGEMRCEAAICSRCTLEVAPGRDLCPKHAGLHRDAERGRAP